MSRTEVRDRAPEARRSRMGGNRRQARAASIRLHAASSDSRRTRVQYEKSELQPWAAYRAGRLSRAARWATNSTEASRSLVARTSRRARRSPPESAVAVARMFVVMPWCTTVDFALWPCPWRLQEEREVDGSAGRQGLRPGIDLERSRALRRLFWEETDGPKCFSARNVRSETSDRSKKTAAPDLEQPQH